MEERGNKTIMCSVFFLDIVGYSKKSVTGQISLKERFNSYLSTAIKHVPAIDRIILDTGDGAAINFLGDIEDALKAALSLREDLLGEDPNRDHPLLVRMGINLGPVRLVRDINGQPNIVGDGINVAQRVMGFADASQILVSRSYFDAVSRVSPHYAGMFHYQGSRTDKHVREHEVYAIGYPGDSTTIGRSSRLFFEGSDGTVGKIYAGASAMLRSVAIRDNSLVALLTTGFWQAKPLQRLLYVLVAVIPLLILIMFLTTLMDEKNSADNFGRSNGQPIADKSSQSSVSWEIAHPDTTAESRVAKVEVETKAPLTVSSSDSGQARNEKSDSKVVHKQRPVEQKTSSSSIKVETGNNKLPPKKVAEPIAAKPDVVVEPASLSAMDFATNSDTVRTMDSRESDATSKAKPRLPKPPNKGVGAVEVPARIENPKTSLGQDAHLFVRCLDGSEIFIDGTRKGRIGDSSITLDISPGMHAVIVSHPRGVDSRNV
ncbi:MAG: adenylate/guanylate cyclase domain-containing protein, partial [Gallionella sp.]